MVSKKEKEKWIIENCIDEHGRIDLNGLNFGERIVCLKGIKTKSIIYNGSQAAYEIDNSEQSALIINNVDQMAWYKIRNNGQMSILKEQDKKSIIVDNKQEKNK